MARWADFKRYIEEQGVRDDDVIWVVKWSEFGRPVAQQVGGNDCQAVFQITDGDDHIKPTGGPEMPLDKNLDVARLLQGYVIQMAECLESAGRKEQADLYRNRLKRVNQMAPFLGAYQIEFPNKYEAVLIPRIREAFKRLRTRILFYKVRHLFYSEIIETAASILRRKGHAQTADILLHQKARIDVAFPFDRKMSRKWLQPEILKIRDRIRGAFKRLHEKEQLRLKQIQARDHKIRLFRDMIKGVIERFGNVGWIGAADILSREWRIVEEGSSFSETPIPRPRAETIIRSLKGQVNRRDVKLEEFSRIIESCANSLKQVGADVTAKHMLDRRDSINKLYPTISEERKQGQVNRRDVLNEARRIQSEIPEKGNSK